MSETVNVRIKVAEKDLAKVKRMAKGRPKDPWPFDRTSPLNMVLYEVLLSGVKRSKLIVPEGELQLACLRLPADLTHTLRNRANAANMIFSKLCAAVIATELAK